LDESGFDMRMKKEYGYSLKGTRLYGEKCQEIDLIKE
jgi:hypothetical protein